MLRSPPPPATASFDLSSDMRIANYNDHEQWKTVLNTGKKKIIIIHNEFL
jgi:hypothetical protein